MLRVSWLACLFAVFFIGKLDRDISSKLFACLVVYLAVKMVLSIKPKINKAVKPLTTKSSIIGGILIGMASSAAGIGGGGFIVPFLNSRGIDMKRLLVLRLSVACYSELLECPVLC